MILVTGQASSPPAPAKARPACASAWTPGRPLNPTQRCPPKVRSEPLRTMTVDLGSDHRPLNSSCRRAPVAAPVRAAFPPSCVPSGFRDAPRNILPTTFWRRCRSGWAWDWACRRWQDPKSQQLRAQCLHELRWTCSDMTLDHRIRLSCKLHTPLKTWRMLLLTISATALVS